MNFAKLRKPKPPEQPPKTERRKGNNLTNAQRNGYLARRHGMKLNGGKHII